MKDFKLSIRRIPEGIVILSVNISDQKKAEQDLKVGIKELSAYKFALGESAIVANKKQQIGRCTVKDLCGTSKELIYLLTLRKH